MNANTDIFTRVAGKKPRPLIWYAAGRIERSRNRFDVVECALINTTDRETPDIQFDLIDVDNNQSKVAIGYSGPFTMGCDHGCSHVKGSSADSESWFADNNSSEGFGTRSHGSGVFCDRETVEKSAVFERSLEGIRKADCVFVWINDSECFGTLVEIGYAKALGKPIYIGYSHDIEPNGELWFAMQAGNCRRFSSAKQAFLSAIKHADACVSRGAA